MCFFAQLLDNAEITLSGPKAQIRLQPYRNTPKPYRTIAFRAPVRESLGTAIQLAHLGMATEDLKLGVSYKGYRKGTPPYRNVGFGC